MGAGNFCPCGRFTDQWYIDYSELNEFYDESNDNIVMDLLHEDVEYLMSEIIHRFPSFSYTKKYLDNYWGQKALLENKLFHIGIADNNWSYAVWIAERDDLEPYEMGLAEGQFAKYRFAIQEMLLNWFGSISLRRGAWMSWKLTKNEEVVGNEV